MAQPSLFDFDPDPPRQAHSATSGEAADRIAPVSGRLRALLWHWLRERGPDGATDEEMQDGLAMPPSTQRPRRVELVEQGRVRDGGRVRKTRSGRKAVVWVAN